MRAVILALATFATACGSDTPVAPSPPPPAQIAGSWSGTFESQTYVTIPIVMSLTEVNTTINGTWASTGGGLKPFGNITGTVDTASFTGIVTYNYAGGPTCTASFAGPVSSAVTTFVWTSPGFTTGSCGLTSPGNPLGVTFRLQRN